MTRAHKELKPEDILAIIDTREQTPWNLSPLKSIRGTLATGDYSICGLQHEVSIERKSLSDLIGCIGVERERFEAEIQRLKAYQVRCIIVEAPWSALERGGWRSKVTPGAAVGSVLGWIAHGMPFIFADDANGAAKAASRLLFIAAKRRFNQLQSFYKSLKVESQ
jgi:DNA excision repair protein ERCC-4